MQRVAVNSLMSKLKMVMSGGPQGLVLGPTLFNIFVGGMDRGTAFADDTKLCGAADMLERRVAIQRNLNRLAIQRNLNRLERHLCKPHEVQQGHVQVPAPGSGQSQAPVQAGKRTD